MTKQLWAPWRLEYVGSADEQEGCIFCLANEGDDEERLVVHRGRRAFVLLNRFPYASGHLMVAPLRHVGEITDLEDDEVLELHRLAGQGLGALAETYGPQGFNLAGTWGGSPERVSRIMCTCTSFHAGPATRTSCPF